MTNCIICPIRRCVALNNYVKKPKRVFKPQVTVVPRRVEGVVSSGIAHDKDGLLPVPRAGFLTVPSQREQDIVLRERESLQLLCAANAAVTTQNGDEAEV